MIDKSMKQKLDIKERADKARLRFKCGTISYDEAMKDIEPYILMANECSKEIAKMLNIKHKKINVKEYLK